jgi:asparagine synthase (glutamine-hydrolysing)
MRWIRLFWETWRHSRLEGGSTLAPLLGYLRNSVSRVYNPWPAADSARHGTWIAADLHHRYRNDNCYAASLCMQPFGEPELLNNTLYQLTFLNNLQMLLKFEDRNSMAFSVEARLPFLDYRIVEFLFSLPSGMKIRDGYRKRVLREAMKGILPEKVRLRVGKLGFTTPEREWQRTILRPLISDAVRSESLKPFIDLKQAVSHLDHVEQNNVLDFAPWRWVSLHLWLKAYVSN